MVSGCGEGERALPTGSPFQLPYDHIPSCFGNLYVNEEVTLAKMQTVHVMKEIMTFLIKAIKSPFPWSYAGWETTDMPAICDTSRGGWHGPVLSTLDLWTNGPRFEWAQSLCSKGYFIHIAHFYSLAAWLDMTHDVERAVKPQSSIHILNIPFIFNTVGDFLQAVFHERYKLIPII